MLPLLDFSLHTYTLIPCRERFQSRQLIVERYVNLLALCLLAMVLFVYGIPSQFTNLWLN